jgi:peptide/nickel transport system substrate-binding protein
MTPKYRLVLLFFVLAIFGLLIGGISTAQEEKVLVVGYVESVDSMDPARAFSFTPFTIFRAAYQTLVWFPPDAVTPLQPDLATSWETSEDGMTYTFYLRDDVVFSNGDPLTAADVVFSFMRFKNVHGNGSFLAESIDTVVAVDDYTVQINMSAPDPALINKLTFGGLSVVNANVVREAGGSDAADAETADTAEQFFYAASAGSGPYILESYEAEVEMVLTRNENYWGEPPYFDRVIFTNIPEASARKLALESGDIDIATAITPEQIASIEETPGLAVLQSAGLDMHYLAMNRDPEVGGPMADPLVGQAVRNALDYEGLRLLNSPSAITPPAMLPVGFFAAFTPEQGIQRDTARAMELLAEAGYADGFEVDMTYWSTTNQGVNFDTNAQKIQADLAEVGITVNLIPTDFAGWIEPYRAGQLAFTIAIWSPDFIDPANYLTFVPAVGDSVTVSNRVNWTEANADPEILELRDLAAVEPNPELRAEHYAGIQTYWQEKGPWAPFLQPAQQLAYRDDIIGPVMHPYSALVDVRLLSRAE